MSRIYMDDCICPGCANCDSEHDICKVDRWRYPTDGCFDFVSRDNPGGDNALTKGLKAIKDHLGR
ncbi:MAG: hypothetical protein KKE05_06340 [Nanoarchaeota archaeon]|nr:hypothetical protein [Nanoarchaeota archaeon]